VAILATGSITVITRLRVSPSARAENLNFGITTTGISLKSQLAATLGAGSHMPLKMVVTRAPNPIEPGRQDVTFGMGARHDVFNAGIE
jgi:hypothetical protein